MANVFLITGATGSIGKALVAQLGQADIRVLARDPRAAERALPGVKAFAWSIGAAVPSAAVQGVDTIIHLAGVPIAEQRLTPERLALVRESRVVGTRAIVDAAHAHGVRAIVCASAVGIYGAHESAELGEDAVHGQGALAEICEAWEAEAQRAEASNIRVVRVRVGLVLDAGAGALGKMLPLFRLGLGGKLGNGKQWMPWIHLQDAAGLFAFAATHPVLHGPMNASAPNPVTNAEFTQAVATTLHRPAFFTVPALALKLALGELGELATMSQRMVPRAALHAGYTFQFPTLASALQNLLGAK